MCGDDGGRHHSFCRYPLPDPARLALQELAARTDVLLVGEVHGTQEVPRVVAGLLSDLAALGYRGLGLEIPRPQRDGLEAWGRGLTPDPPAFFAQPAADGRGNCQVLSLVRQALGTGDTWQVLCFDQGPDQLFTRWEERDEWMARNLLAQRDRHCPGGKVVAICGNLHARVAPGRFGRRYWPSLAGWLRQFQPQLAVHSVKVIFHTGAFFNMGVRRILPRFLPWNAPARIRAPKRRGYTLELQLPRATPATFLSPPTSSASARSPLRHTDPP